ncbi:MAG TPA: hypothetical protein VKY73_13320 [Polyangiaceae bacterium]|nr:hypothetical protein [Polyangiaceae bacterium]
MPLPESFKFDTRVRERLLRRGLLSEAEVEKHLSALTDAAEGATEVDIKQPALQTDAERDYHLVVRSAPAPRPLSVAPPPEEPPVSRPMATETAPVAASVAAVPPSPEPVAPPPQTGDEADASAASPVSAASDAGTEPNATGNAGPEPSVTGNAGPEPSVTGNAGAEPSATGEGAPEAGSEEP